ncbi:MAG: carboxypeptidase-like regulatory domain-containing protein [Planctomycetota bacterium]
MHRSQWLLLALVIVAALAVSISVDAGRPEAAEVAPARDDVPAVRPRHEWPSTVELAAPSLTADEREPLDEAPVPEPTGAMCSAFGSLILPGGFVPSQDVVVVANRADGSTFPERHRGKVSRDGWTWRIDDLGAGPWRFTVLARSSRDWAFGRTEVLDVDAAVETGPIDLSLRVYRVEGVVTDPAGSPIAGVRVCSASMISVMLGGSRVASASVGGKTDAAGRYLVPLPGPAEFELVAGGFEERKCVRQERTVRVSEEQPTVTVDFVLERTVGISGCLTRADGGDLTDVSVVLRALELKSEWRCDVDEQGRFDVSGLAPGTFALYARARLGGGRYVTAHERIELESGRSAFVVDQLMPSAKALGRVLDAEGNAVADTQVRLVGDDDRGVSHFASSDASGRFMFVGLYDRAYRVEVTGHRLAADPGRVVVGLNAGTVDVGDLVVD